MKSGAAFSAELRAAVTVVAASAHALAGLVGANPDVLELDLPGTDVASDADPLREVVDACLESLAEVARLEARTAALKVRLIADYVQAAEALAPPAASARERAAEEMSLIAEVACVLTVSERTAGVILSEGRALLTALPLTLESLQAGTISWQHARIMVDESAGMDASSAAELEAHFLDPDAPDPARGCPAGELVASRFRAKARAWRERHHPDSIETRHTKSAADRRIEYCPDRDGMAWLSAYLPADTAAGIWERTTASARALQGPGEDRTLTQLRADVAAIWLLTGGAAEGGRGSGGAMAGRVPAPRAQVLVTVPALSLLGVAGEPAFLDGHGPIPPSMARRLVADGADSLYRVLTDPRDGAPLEIGRTSYRIPKAMRQWLRLRDGKCPFPGCNNPSLDNEADHLLAWADGGTTGISNLGQPCRKHHRLKHGTAWNPTPASKDHPPGWTAPSGRRYPSEHQDWEPPIWPHEMLTTEGFVGHVLPTDSGPWVEPGPVPDEDAGWPPGHKLLEDPSADWYDSGIWRGLPPTDTGEPCWPKPEAIPSMEGLLLQPV